MKNTPASARSREWKSLTRWGISRKTPTAAAAARSQTAMPSARAQRRGEAPADRDHPAHAHPEQPAFLRVDRGRAQGEAELRVAEEHADQQDEADRDRDVAEVLNRERDARDLDRPSRERVR